MKCRPLLMVGDIYESEMKKYENSFQGQRSNTSSVHRDSYCYQVTLILVSSFPNFVRTDA